MANTSTARLVPLRMAGACRSGGDTRGTVIHAVLNGRYGEQMDALCGKYPRLFWSDNGIDPDAPITCPKCAKIIATAAGAEFAA